MYSEENQLGKWFWAAVASFALVQANSAVAAAFSANDGIADSWRIQYFGTNWTDSPASVATADPDGDGVNNFQEYLDGTSPVDARSHNDVPVGMLTYAGTTAGNSNGPLNKATFNKPYRIRQDRQGRLWVVESHDVRMIATNGTVSTVAGGALSGMIDGPGIVARFSNPSDVAFDSAGNAFVVDCGNHRIRKISTNGIVTTFAGSTSGFRDGSSTNAQFASPWALEIDGNNNIYVADFSNSRIRMITPDGDVATYAGSSSGYQDGDRLTQARFSRPNGLAIADDGTIFVSDWGNGAILRIATNGWVSIFASRYACMERVSFDRQGNLLAIHANRGDGGRTLHKFNLAGELLWSLTTPMGYADGPIGTAQFAMPSHPVVMDDGSLLFADGFNHRLRSLLMQPPAMLAIAPGSTLFTNQVAVEISKVANNAVIRYTLDGSVPTADSPLYTGPIILDRSAKLNAMLFVNASPVSSPASASYQQYVSIPTVMPTGGYAWYRAENNALDTITGASAMANGNISYATGQVGMAFDLDGVNDEIWVPATTNLNGKSVSVEGWVYPRSSGASPVVEFSGGGHYGLQLWLNIDGANVFPGKIYVNIQNDTVTPYQQVVVSASGIVPANQWTHLAMTYDQTSGKVVIYANGTQVASGTASMGPRVDLPINIGFRPNGNHLNGLLDELTIYDRALASNEIYSIYYAGAAGKDFCTVPSLSSQTNMYRVPDGQSLMIQLVATGSLPMDFQWWRNGAKLDGQTNRNLSISAVSRADAGDYLLVASNRCGCATGSLVLVEVVPPTKVLAPEGLVGWWRAENTGLDSVSGIQASITGAVTFATGKVGSAFDLNGTNGAIIAPPNSNLSVKSFAIESWIYPRDNRGQAIVEYSSPGTYGVHLWLNVGIDGDAEKGTPGALYANVTSSGAWHQIATSGGAIPLNQWTHVGLTYDQTSGVSRLYINGKIAASANFGTFTPLTSLPLNIGTRHGYSRYIFNGLIDEVSVYNRALGADVMEDLYFAGKEGKTGVQMPPETISVVSLTNSLTVNQRGLFTQAVSFSNSTATAFSAVRLWVALDAASLAKGVRVYNATGTNAAGTPYLQYNQALAPGKTVDFVIEYYIPDRRTVPAPTLTADVVPVEAVIDPAGTGAALAIDRVVALPDGSRMVEFSTVTNGVYYLQYSSDMTTWKTAQPAIRGTGSRLQWFDNGPPKTESMPTTEAMRIYRIILVP